MTKDELKIYKKKWGEKNKEKLRSYRRKWNKLHPEYFKTKEFRMASKKWRKKWYTKQDEKELAKIRVRKILQQAVRRGGVIRGNCYKCNKPNTQAHHKDYSKPFDVIWVCPLHHSEFHKQRSADYSS